MTFKLNTALAMDSIADEEDVRALKSALNRLGYYMPYEKTGITDMPDTHMFDALKKFQSDHGLKADGIIRPDDQSFLAIATALTADTKDRFYIWRTVRDNHVRSQHAAREGKVFSWNKAPEGGHPGEDYNCRCWAEPASHEQYWQMVDPPIEPAYPELIFLSFLGFGRIGFAWRSWVIAGKAKRNWTLGSHKSPKKWANQFEKRGWTPEEINRTINKGKKYPAPNKVNKGNTATRFQLKDRFVVKDDQTDQILQVSGDSFTPME
jgi:SPP1 gp7 family putative phage head morphogenesis protein